MMSLVCRTSVGLAASLLVASAPALAVNAQNAPAARPSAAATAAASSSVSAGAPTCAEDPLFRAQDFTLGNWTVLSGNRPVARVSITRTLKGCALSENWQVGEEGPGSGIGLFTYSRLYRRWFYLWAENRGSATSFSGTSPEPGKLVYTTLRPVPGGKVRRREWTLTLEADGSVRETSRGTEDNGATWIPEYDLHWVR